MSPYQQDVIDKTLEEYDIQAGKGLAGIGQLAAKSGNLGGGREGVARAEYQSASDRNRALLQAQMLQGGFGQAQQAAGQAFGQQMGLGQATGALGQQQLGIGQYQQGLAGLVPQLYGQDTAAYGAAGAQQQAFAQAEADAAREAARMEAYEPYERLGYLGTGITGMLGGYPGQYQSQITPNPTPLQSALGIGTGLAGMYGAYKDFKDRGPTIMSRVLSRPMFRRGGSTGGITTGLRQGYAWKQWKRCGIRRTRICRSSRKSCTFKRNRCRQ